ncbi:hypothetical protein TPA0598_02_07720 [Streptomyces lydicamycinicus]|uniref:Uncharacterized protein n=1 Tax=Streptomyces lydicamycinicus TaxID=1546107 RepID=A0A0P4R5A8_9ACTN|nr:hypothetical protein TPA0598_02_07720 [Streptomyces lydicamycinicus]
MSGGVDAAECRRQGRANRPGGTPVRRARALRRLGPGRPPVWPPRRLPVCGGVKSSPVDFRPNSVPYSPVDTFGRDVNRRPNGPAPGFRDGPGGGLRPPDRTVTRGE